MLSTNARWHALALALYALLAAFLLRDGLHPDRVLISRESLQNSLPWSAVLERAEPHNRFVGDQPRIFYPYLVEAAKVYEGAADALWTSRGGGGQPFLGNITSKLFHPLTLLAAAFPITVVPLLQGLLVLWLSAFFTWAFLRRLGLGPPAALFGGLAFGFGGHQVLWLQYALSHTLLALPFCFWAVERLVADRSRRRLAVLAMGFAMLVFGGHPETAFVAALVAGLWALWRLWDAHGRPLVVGAGALAVALAAIQWMPFLEYASNSHGLNLREIESARMEGHVALSSSLIWGFFALISAALLRSSATRGLLKHVFTVGGVALTVVLARRMGMAMAAMVPALPEVYGSPIHPPGGVFTGAQDFPGLNAGYAGVLPVVLLVLGVFAGAGTRYVRVFAALAFVLWGAAYDMPLVRPLVDLLPGISEIGSTRLLGPVGFLVACGGACVLERLLDPKAPRGLPRAMGRVGLVLGVGLLLAFAVLRLPVDPHGGREVIAGLRSPSHEEIHDGSRPIEIVVDLPLGTEELAIRLDGLTLFRAPVPPTTPDAPFSFRFAAQRTEDGRHRLTVTTAESSRPLADQPLAITRERQLSGRDLLAVGVSLAALGWFIASKRRPSAAWLALAVVGVDLFSFGDGYNPATPVNELYPPTQTGAFLAEAWEEHGPFRVFTEGNILPPDTHYMLGVDHLLSYDNLGYRRMHRWLIEVPIMMDAFASFAFDQSSVAYASPRFDSLDVRYVLTGLGTSLEHIPGMRLAHESETRVWENTDNLGRAWVVGEQALVAAERRDQLLTMHPGEVAFVEAYAGGPLGGRGEVTALRHEGSRIEVRAQADGPALLVLAENFAPGWSATVNGAEVESRHADSAWQAVPIPEGASEIVFTYDPPGYRWGRRISLVAAVIWLAMLLLPRRIG